MMCTSTKATVRGGEICWTTARLTSLGTKYDFVEQHVHESQRKFVSMLTSRNASRSVRLKNFRPDKRGVVRNSSCKV